MMHTHYQLRGTSRRIAAMMAHCKWGAGKRFRVEEVRQKMIDFFDGHETPSSRLIELCLGQFARLNLLEVHSIPNGIFTLTERGAYATGDILSRAVDGEEDFTQAIPPSLRVRKTIPEAKAVVWSPLMTTAPIGARDWGAV